MVIWQLFNLVATAVAKNKPVSINLIAKKRG